MIACRIVAAAACFVVLHIASARGENAAPPPPITSNRPGIGDSEALVGRGVVQLELGIQTQVTRFGGERDWTTDWGQSTLRVGIVDAVEVYVSWGGVAVDRVAETGSTRIVTGATDLLVGAKIALLDESRHFLTLTASPATSVPIGRGDFSSGSYRRRAAAVVGAVASKGLGPVRKHPVPEHDGRQPPLLGQPDHDEHWPLALIVHQRLRGAGDRPRRSSRLDAGRRGSLGPKAQPAMGRVVRRAGPRPRKELVPVCRSHSTALAQAIRKRHHGHVTGSLGTVSVTPMSDRASQIRRGARISRTA